MKRFVPIALAFISACRPAVTPIAPTSQIGADVAVLSSPAWTGREAGTAGGDSAAEFLAERYRRLGLRPAFRSSCEAAPTCHESYFQSFHIMRGVAKNVAAAVDGSDSLLRHQFVVLGAHYDGLGRSLTFALDRNKGFIIRPGADDNASGTAALLELARRFRDRPAHRSILIVNFDAEELGLVGSRAFLTDSPVPRQAVTFMLNLDMIGRLRDNKLFVQGVRERAARAWIDGAAAAVGLRADYVENAELSDHATFLDLGIDAVALSTGNHEDYHKASDTAARIDYAGVDRVVDVAEAIIRRVADR